MGYTVSLTLESARDRLLTSREGHELTKGAFTGTISSDNQKDVFLAVTSNELPPDSPERTITVQLFDLEGAPSSNTITIGLWERQEIETHIICKLLDQQGKEVATDKVSYPLL